jgi:hypothetical protein
MALAAGQRGDAQLRLHPKHGPGGGQHGDAQLRLPSKHDQGGQPSAGRGTTSIASHYFGTWGSGGERSAGRHQWPQPGPERPRSQPPPPLPPPQNQPPLPNAEPAPTPAKPTPTPAPAPAPAKPNPLPLPYLHLQNQTHSRTCTRKTKPHSHSHSRKTKPRTRTRNPLADIPEISHLLVGIRRVAFYDLMSLSLSWSRRRLRQGVPSLRDEPARFPAVCPRQTQYMSAGLSGSA